MTRCLDCGAAREVDQCPLCGLTSAAAEVMFRKRLIKQTTFFPGRFAAVSLRDPYLSAARSGPDAGLLWRAVFCRVDHRRVSRSPRRKHQDIEILKRIYAGFIPLPWILAAAIFLNGRLDAPGRVAYVPAEVQGKFLMKGLVRGSRRLVVHSWRPDQKFERLPVDPDDFDRFAVGDRIEVAVEPGVLGIPWVYGVYREGRPRE
jgi:hypothetical protein